LRGDINYSWDILDIVRIFDKIEHFGLGVYGFFDFRFPDFGYIREEAKDEKVLVIAMKSDTGKGS